MKRLLTLVAFAVILSAGAVTPTELVDGWNIDNPAVSGAIYPYPSNYAMLYEPTAGYLLERLEFWAAGSTFMPDDSFTVQIQTDFDNQPSGEVLASVAHPLVDGAADWEGSDFLPPVELQGGQIYWIVYFAQPWSPIGWAVEGDEIPTMFSGDQIHWDPSGELPWKVKFWGDPSIVGTEDATWTGVKAIFR